MIGTVVRGQRFSKLEFRNLLHEAPEEFVSYSRVAFPGVAPFPQFGNTAPVSRDGWGEVSLKVLTTEDAASQRNTRSDS